MPHFRNKRSLRVAASVAVLSLPLGLALPAVADENPTSDPSPTVEADQTATPDPISTEPAPAAQTPTPEGTQTDSPEVDDDVDQEPVEEIETFEDNSYAVFGNELGIDPELQTEEGLKPQAQTYSTAQSHKFFLNDEWTGDANIAFEWGDPKYEVFSGDWNGDGIDTVALRSGQRFAFADTNPAYTAPKFTVSFGRPGDTVLVGDWDGDGRDTVAIRRGNEFHVNNSLTSGSTDSFFIYGRPGDEVFVGDWNGDGKDTLAVRRGNQFHIKNSNSGGYAERVVSFGRANDDIYVGSYDRVSSNDSFAVRRGNTYHINKSLKSGVTDLALDYGRANDVALVGDWNGDGEDTLGVVRTVPAGSTPAPTPPPAPTTDKGSEVLAFAKKYSGAPYSWGGVTPAGWDCIGLIRYVYSNHGVDIGGYPHSVLAAGKQVPFSQAEPGDILYWSKENSVANSAHVALYVDSSTNFGSWNVSMGTREGPNSWVGGTPVVIRVFE
ncbi:NlpC/P60 family protein [Actinomycetaceae bacterium L2_0104]